MWERAMARSASGPRRRGGIGTESQDFNNGRAMARCYTSLTPNH